MIDPTSSHRRSIPKLPFHLSILNKPLTSLIHTDTQLFGMIVDSLKQYEPFSIPFLHKVSKRDVPNYYDFIKNPMDLGTLQKNMKKYNKQSFKANLDLIWDNCVFFNGPSIYTDYAEKMRERANYLWDYLFTKEVIIERPTEPNYFLENINLTEEIEIEENDLDMVKFNFQNFIELGHFSKRNRYFMNVKLGKNESLRILEQVIVVYIGAMGFVNVETSAVKIIADIIYNLMFKQCRKIKHGLTPEILNLKGCDLEIIKLPINNASMETFDEDCESKVEGDVNIKLEMDSETNIEKELESLLNEDNCNEFDKFNNDKIKIAQNVNNDTQNNHTKDSRTYNTTKEIFNANKDNDTNIFVLKKLETIVMSELRHLKNEFESISLDYNEESLQTKVKNENIFDNSEIKNLSSFDIKDENSHNLKTKINSKKLELNNIKRKISMLNNNDKHDSNKL